MSTTDSASLARSCRTVPIRNRGLLSSFVMFGVASVDGDRAGPCSSVLRGWPFPARSKNRLGGCARDVPTLHRAPQLSKCAQKLTDPRVEMGRLISDCDPGQGLRFAELDHLGRHLMEVLKLRCDEFQIFQKLVKGVVELRKLKDGVAVLCAEPLHYFAHGCFRCHQGLPLGADRVSLDEIPMGALALPRFTRTSAAVRGYGESFD